MVIIITYIHIYFNQTTWIRIRTQTVRDRQNTEKMYKTQKHKKRMVPCKN